MDDSIFRKKNLDRLMSTEECWDYLHVAGPSTRLIFAALLLPLAGLLVWGFTAGADSLVAGMVRVLQILFD